MSFLRNLFGRRDEESGPDLAVTLDVESRKAQLVRLENALDNLAAAMRENQSLMDNPGWRERAGEYGRAAGAAMTLRNTTVTREGLLDLVFEIRPVFSGPIPNGLESLGPLQDEVMALAGDLQELLPGERD